MRLILETTVGTEFSVDKLVEIFSEYKFEKVNEISDGYTDGIKVAVANRKNKAQEVASLFHELAHCRLGHCKLKGTKAGQELSRDRQELEAEAVAYLVCSALDIEQKEGSALYLGAWRGDVDKLEASAYRILGIADKILRQIAEHITGEKK